MVRCLLYIFIISSLYSCSSEVFDNTEREPERNDVFISTYKPSSSGDILITGGRVLTGTGEELEDVDIPVSYTHLRAHETRGNLV